MLYNFIEQRVWQKTIQQLTFTYCFSLRDLCDFAYGKEYLDKYGYEEDWKNVLGDDYVKYQRKFSNLLQRICIEKKDTHQPAKLLAEPKIYDEFMFESQVALYNVLAPEVPYPPIDVILPVHMLDELSLVDDITTLYPYYPDRNRKGANFIECILLLTMRLTLQKRSLNILDKKPESHYDKKRVKEMVDKLVEAMQSEQMFNLYVYAFFDIFEKNVVEKHRELAEKTVRLAWLPDNLKNRADEFDSFERYKKRFAKTLDEDCSEEQMYRLMLSENTNGSQRAYDSAYDFSAIDLISSFLLPMSLGMIMGRKKEAYDISDPKIKKAAKKYVQNIKKYINKAISEATNILNKLYIENL